MDLALQGLWAETRTLDLALFQREGSIRSASPKETFVEKVTTAARVVNRLVKGSALKKVPDHFSCLLKCQIYSTLFFMQNLDPESYKKKLRYSGILAFLLAVSSHVAIFNQSDFLNSKLYAEDIFIGSGPVVAKVCKQSRACPI